MLKTCSKCEQEKPLSEFHKKTGDRRQSYCKPCFNAYCIERWQRRKIAAIKAKGGKCCECGYDRNYAALEFHHRDQSQKDVQWDKLRLRSQAAIDKELAKCDLVCRNCHAEKHNPQGFDF